MWHAVEAAGLAGNLSCTVTRQDAVDYVTGCSEAGRSCEGNGESVRLAIGSSCSHDKGVVTRLKVKISEKK